MDRAAIKALATSMLQNRTSISPAYFDEVLDGVYSHTLVDAIPSMARRGQANVSLLSPTLVYQLPDTWRALDGDNGFLTGGIEVPIYTSQEAWLGRPAPATTVGAPTRALLYGDESEWFLELDAVPAAATPLYVPGTFYRGALPATGTPNFNEAMALVYGLVLHIALMQSLTDIAKDAQAGFTTQLGVLRSQYGSERATPTNLPPARDF